MSFVEQPDRIGRTLLIGTAAWTVVGLAVFASLKLAFPERTSPVPVVESRCHPTVPTVPYDPLDAADPAIAVVTAPSRCTMSSPTTTPDELLRAYLEGAELDSSPRAQPLTVDAALLARGTELYLQHCAACHGATGDGAGPDACALHTPPAVHKSGVFSLRTTEHEALPTDEDIFRTITRGVHGTAMPPWFVLPEADRWALVAHVKSLSTQFQEDVAPPPLESNHPPVATSVQIATGHWLYLHRGCSSCHGETGQGNGPAAASLPAQPRDFTSGRFHRGSSAADIHETLMTGLDGTPMASFLKVMTPDELWEVSFYVHSLAPPMVEREGVWCPATARSLDPEELFGMRELMHTMQHVTSP